MITRLSEPDDDVWIRPGTPALTVAPMEGVTDAPMRALLTERGGFAFCVSEFLRVSQNVIPAHVFLSHVPELKNGAKTPSGTPVQIQLLGGDPERMALSALRAVQAGARSIDINFGCPAPTVNRHDGGATLLKYPERVRRIVSEVRTALPRTIPVSAKLRLGWDDPAAVYANAEAAAAGGSSWITIHGRTKTQAYQPPAYWEPIGRVRRELAGLPVVANGDIWSLEDFRRCREITGCEHFMLGRGALADPSLAQQVAAELGIAGSPMVKPFGTSASSWAPLLERFRELSLPSTDCPSYVVKRIKQWVRLASAHASFDWLEPLKRSQSLEEIFALLDDPRYAAMPRAN